MRVTADEVDPQRERWSWAAVWEGDDRGLIAAWEAGRKMAKTTPQLAAAALNGELVMLPWKGGVERAIKGRKYGSLLYAAMWRGLRGEALDMRTDEECVLTCSRTEMTVCYTPDLSLLSTEG